MLFYHRIFVSFEKFVVKKKRWETLNNNYSYKLRSITSGMRLRLNSEPR